MLGPGTQRIYVPERYRDWKSFTRILEKKFGNAYYLGHIAPSGSNIYFVSKPTIPTEVLEEFEDKLWEKEKSM